MARILVIEDDIEMLHSLNTVLRASGHRITLASDGRRGIKAFKRYEFDLVITDILMPGVDGLASIREIKKIKPETKIIAISGGGQHLAKEQLLKYALSFGANGVLKKPFGNKELMAAVKTCLETVGSRGTSATTAGAQLPCA